MPESQSGNSTRAAACRHLHDLEGLAGKPPSEVERVLGGCPVCRERWRSWRDQTQLLKRLDPRPQGAPDLWARIRPQVGGIRNDGGFPGPW